jgi:hypothetical protein
LTLAGPFFFGSLGNATEGSIPAISLIKWPGRIAQRISDETLAAHDRFQRWQASSAQGRR